ncbi:cell division protein FtsQ/DivIB [Isoptericola sp. S6320L]|uniref:cell division protein FtsQ/DivIB n=1 Tax=Isoptericola sp. S6320L TaxID=2926411 RepID=UPI001FF4E62A|nr:cell division protein FtsQ/DivIB [Isoptericola sp. S6320L]MCK0116606.1 cell division protein FtsQ/DivIB [Isoptericola sp. S6320L]
MRPPPRPRTPQRPSSASGAGSARSAASPARPAERPARPAGRAVERSASSAASAASPSSAATTSSAAGAAGTGSPGRVSSAMADRLAERSAMRRHRSWRLVVAVVLVLALLGGAGWVAGWSELLALERSEVSVSGAGTTVDADRVREVVEAAAGTPLLRIDTGGMRREILGLRGVKDVSVQRSWPQGIQVLLTAREPVAAVPDGDRYVLLDAEGVRVGSRQKAPRKLPVVSVPLDEESADSLRAALAVVAALPVELALEVEQVSAQTQDDVETVLRDGVSVRWGGETSLPLKVEVVQTLREVAADAGVIDVSSPELPVTR